MDKEGSKFFQSLDIPVVLLQARCEIERSISTNNFIGGQDAARYLISRGYRKIGFVGWEPDDEHIHDLFMCFTSDLHQAQLPLNEYWHKQAPLSTNGGYQVTKELLEHSDIPEVIFYGCDDMAAGGYRYIREHDLRISEDIGLMGFDDLAIAETISLTTMKQFVEKKSDMAVSYLMGRLSGETEKQSDEISITPKLVIRNSTKCPAYSACIMRNQSAAGCNPYLLSSILQVQQSVCVTEHLRSK